MRPCTQRRSLVTINLVHVHETRTCVGCGLAKRLTEYGERKDRGVWSLRRDCRECRKVVLKSYYVKSPQVRLAFRARNSANVLAYYTRTPHLKDHRKQVRQKWAEQIMQALRAKRRALEISARGVCTPAQLKARFQVYDDRCAYCGGPAEAADHVIPLARGGSNWPANIRPSCTSCNSSKGAKKLSEWKLSVVAV